MARINLIFIICLCLLYGVVICAGIKPCYLHTCQTDGPVHKNNICPTEEHCTCGDEPPDNEITERVCDDKDKDKSHPLSTFNGDTIKRRNMACYESSCFAPHVSCPIDRCSCFDESGSESDDITITRFCKDKPAQPQFPNPTYDCTSQPTCNDPDNPCEDDCFCDNSISKCIHMVQPLLPDDDLYDCTSKPTCNDPDDPCEDDCFCDNSISNCIHIVQPLLPDDDLYDCTSKPTCNDPDNPCKDDCFCDNSISKCIHIVQPLLPDDYLYDCTSKPTCNDPGDPCGGDCFCDNSIGKCKDMSDYIDFEFYDSQMTDD